ncbi:MAG: hypothetical protein WBD55_01665 [Dehalococcoidia bacterium]
MTGEEAFQIAAAVAAISGLAALLTLCLLAIVGVWRLFERADDVSQASTRALVSVEELTRRIAAVENLPLGDGSDQFSQLRQQAETLLDQQRRLQELAGSLLETGELEGGTPAVLLEDLEHAVQRLDSTVGQMAASLANVIQLLEQTSRERV